MFEAVVIDFIKTVVLGVVLGFVVAEVNMWLIKREVRKMSKSLVYELSRHLKDNGEVRERVEEYARLAGQVFGREVIKVVVSEFRGTPVRLPKPDELVKDVERIKKELSL